MSFALVATARKNSSVSSASKPAIEAGGSSDRNRQQRAARDVDRADAERLVHRDRGVAVAADAGAVAERLVERLAERDADVLDRVVGAGLQVALRASTRGRAGRGGRAARACGRRIRRRSRRATSPPSRSSARLISVSRVLRSIVRGSRHGDELPAKCCASCRRSVACAGDEPTRRARGTPPPGRARRRGAPSAAAAARRS